MSAFVTESKEGAMMLNGGRYLKGRAPILLIRNHAVNGALKYVSPLKSKLLSLVIGFAFFIYASECLAQEGIHVNAMQVDSNTDRIVQDVVSPHDNVVIRLTNDLVSVSVDNAAMRNVLSNFSAQSGIKTWVSDNLKPAQVTEHFEALPIDEALRRLLRGSNYALVYDGKADNASITGVYVLPPGEELPANLVLITENNITAGSQVLENALKSNSIPDNIKVALLSQDHANTVELKQTVMAQRSQAIYKLIEHLEEVGASDPETMRQLRSIYELQKKTTE